LNFNEYAKEGTRAFALAGNQPLKLANNQIKTIVRTSINQVSNAASQSVYAANKDVAPEYEYVATLDSRTSSICQRLDGQKFGYDKGPTPPQHFNCRSTTVPVVDYEGLGLTPPPETKITTRPSETGRVPQKVSYGDWLYEQRARGANDKLLKYEPGELQIKTLGFEKAKYFNRLAAKSNGKDALRQVIRSDGTELTLEQLKKKYGKPSDIKAAKKVTPKVKTLTNTQPTTETWQPTSDFKEGIKRGESMTKGRFEKTKGLSTKYKKAFNDYEEASEKYFTYSYSDAKKEAAKLLGSVPPQDEMIKLYRDRRIELKQSWIKSKATLTKLEVEGAKEMAILRKETLKTTITDQQIKERLDSIPFTNQKKADRLKVRSEVEEFSKMFNGGGVTVKSDGASDGQITKVKLGTSRANNNWKGEILVPFADPKNSYMELLSKQTVFHEIGHSLETSRKANLSMAVNWRTSRASSPYRTKSPKLVKKAWTLQESVIPDEFITPYVGRPYYTNKGLDSATEVISVGVEHFASPELMFRLYSVDPDHFHMILSLTRNVY
jgi:SPP1 gp7 family putative phage head morphogenesis protein